jgi:alkylresorcinol/alkylpyrone synthase
MPQIISTATAFPPHYYEQHELERSLIGLGEEHGVHFDPRRVRRLFDAVSVEGRYLALPMEEYPRRAGFGARNDAWIETAMTLGERVLTDLFERSGMGPDETRLLASTTVTGLAVPSIDARLMNRLRFRESTKRLPLFGLGCVAGAAGIARLADYLRAYPDEAAVLLSVELCSLTVQAEDDSMANIVASSLFGDGAAAALLVGDEHRLANGRHPRVVASRSVFFPDTERVMGWDVVDTGFRIVLDPVVPQLARERLPEAVRSFLAERNLAIGDVDVWIAHPGGPAVMDGVEAGLGLAADALARSRRSLSRIGNVSSASVLAILDETLRAVPRNADDHPVGLLFAMGPGFCAELVLLQW